MDSIIRERVMLCSYILLLRPIADALKVLLDVKFLN